MLCCCCFLFLLLVFCAVKTHQMTGTQKHLKQIATLALQNKGYFSHYRRESRVCYRKSEQLLYGKRWVFHHVVGNKWTRRLQFSHVIANQSECWMGPVPDHISSPGLICRLMSSGFQGLCISCHLSPTTKFQDL